MQAKQQNIKTRRKQINTSHRYSYNKQLTEPKRMTNTKTTKYDSAPKSKQTTSMPTAIHTHTSKHTKHRNCKTKHAVHKYSNNENM